MATTEPRTGFRLPWSSDDKAATRHANDQHDAGTSSSEADAPADHASIAEAEPMGLGEQLRDTSSTPPSEAPGSGATGTPVLTAIHPGPTGPSAAAPRKPTKFLADLTRAMQTAAESARASNLEQLQVEAKEHIERVRARGAAAAADLRKRADGDVIGIREWSKAATARIRDETELKIADRKSSLERELEVRAAQIEQQLERVQSHVSAYEAEMGRFFERLLQEDDPAEIAALAENLPEPPPFDADDSVAEPVFAAPREAVVSAGWTADRREPSQAAEAPFGEIGVGADTIDDAADAPGAPVADDAAEPAPEPEVDPPLFGVGHSPDLGAAEAEAAAAAADSSDDDLVTIDADALAVRLTGLVPADVKERDDPGSVVTPSISQVVVTGLVSVASIASFKRHLGRIAGVQAVGVSSGPDGEFVFTVAHGAEIDLGDLVQTLPGFEARVTGIGAGVVNVIARDPEAGS